MNDREILNVFEALLRVSQHPGIKEVRPYGPGTGGLEGVKVRFGWGADDHSWGYLSAYGADRELTVKPFAARAPYAEVPDPANPGGMVEKWLLADYFLKLVHDLCDTAKPAPLTGWTPVALENIGWGDRPTALAVSCADGTKQVLSVTVGSGPTGDPKEDPWVEYVIPEGVNQWQKQMGIRKEPVKR